MKKLLQAKTFIIPAMRAGLCEYSEERVLVSNKTLEQMSKTSFGIPLVINHVEHDELKANLDKHVVGRVADMHYDEAQDLWLAHCVAETEEALELFEKGWGVSTSYQVDKKGSGGSLNAVPYDSEILEGTYLHLAIVENPRYEMAKNPTFYNSKPLTEKTAPSTIVNNTTLKGVAMLRFFKTKREEVKENASDFEVEIEGEKVALDTLISAYKDVKNNKKNDEDAEAKMNEEVDKLLKGIEKDDKKNEDKSEDDKKKDDKKNTDDEDEDDKEEVKNKKKNEDDSDDSKKNKKKNDDDSEDEDDKESKEKEKEEAKNKKNSRFEELKNAKEKAVLDNDIAGFKTLAERAEIGRQRYGSK